MLRIRCRTRLPVAVSISTSLGTSTIPVDAWRLTPGVRKVWFRAGGGDSAGVSRVYPHVKAMPLPPDVASGFVETSRNDAGDRAGGKIYPPAYLLHHRVKVPCRNLFIANIADERL